MHWLSEKSVNLSLILFLNKQQGFCLHIISSSIRDDLHLYSLLFDLIEEVLNINSWKNQSCADLTRSLSSWVQDQYLLFQVNFLLKFFLETSFDGHPIPLLGSLFQY